MATEYIVHTVTDGDTLQSIALKYGVNWQDIADLNGLESPYIDTSIQFNESRYTDTVAKLGSKLVIPSEGLTFGNRENNTSEELAKNALGTDLDIYSYEMGDNYNVVNLEIKGQLTDNGKGDLRLAEGLSNLKQQLIIRLGTTKGSLPLHPEFGSNLVNFIGLRVTSQLLIKTRLEIRETLLTDPRVLQVGKIDVAYKDKAVHVSCNIVPIQPYPTFTLEHTYFN